MISALIGLGIIAAMGIPIWLGLRTYDHEREQIYRRRALLDELEILRIKEEFRERDKRYASLANAG